MKNLLMPAFGFFAGVAVGAFAIALGVEMPLWPTVLTSGAAGTISSTIAIWIDRR